MRLHLDAQWLDQIYEPVAEIEQLLFLRVGGLLFLDVTEQSRHDRIEVQVAVSVGLEMMEELANVNLVADPAPAFDLGDAEMDMGVVDSGEIVGVGFGAHRHPGCPEPRKQLISNPLAGLPSHGHLQVHSAPARLVRKASTESRPTKKGSAEPGRSQKPREGL